MKTFRRFGTSVGAALLLVTGPAVGAADPVTGAPTTGTAAPVTIGACAPIMKQAQQQIAGIPLSSASSGFHIQFTNEANKTADLINFAVDSNGNQFVIRDVGTFSPGVAIDHKYSNGAGQAFVLPDFIAPTVSCRVAAVKFTDGSVWPSAQASNPLSAGAPTRAVLAANPARLEIDGGTDSELFLIKSSERVTAFKETDDCAGVATVFVAATGQSSATYAVKPLGVGTCTATVADEAGTTVRVPIAVRP